MSPSLSSQRVEPGSVNIPPATFPSSSSDDVPATAAVAAAADIVSRLNAALGAGDLGAVGVLFLPDGYWRDHLGLSWDLRTLKGRDKIVAYLRRHGAVLHDFALDGGTAWKDPHVVSFDGLGGTGGIQLYHSFRTKIGRGRGIARLMRDDSDEWKIWTISTVLEELTGHEEPRGPRRAQGVTHGAFLDRESWLDRRFKEMRFGDAQPDVLIIGAGQAGLTAHARLRMLSVPALIIDSNAAVGDNWRKRYHQLVLHDPVWYDHLPYLPFPETWPVFTPKDKLAEWFESYARLMELNVWMNTRLVSAKWNGDDAHSNWTVVVERTAADGTKDETTLYPKHIVQATGHSGQKNYPFVKGMDAFKGTIMCHSSDFPGPSTAKGQGKKAVVVGSCNSAHDICHDFYERGYDVTMVQRSTTCVVSSEAVTEILIGATYSEEGPPPEDGDLANWGVPSECNKAVHVNLAKRTAAHDAETLKGLEKAGFQLDRGPDDAGLYMKYLQRGGGYYIDVGASRLIAEGKIKIRQGREVAEVWEKGIRLEGGEELEADELVFATGYANMRSKTREIFGDDVADRVGDVWGFDEEGETRTLWRRSRHPGLWLHGGNLAMCRYFSRLVALQIKGALLGINDEAEKKKMAMENGV